MFTELVERYTTAASAHEHHPVLLIGLLDLSIIHPFDDGNGRVARALTNALLIDQGYTVSRYVSLEELIGDSAPASALRCPGSATRRSESFSTSSESSRGFGFRRRRIAFS